MKKKYYIFEMKMLELNVISILICLVMIFISKLLKINLIEIFTGNSMLIVFAFFVPYLILHEILHSVSYVLNGANFKYITYGINLEKGVLCCLCKQNISKRNILISLLFPFFVIGVFTYIIGILINSDVLILLSFLNIAGCSGDLIMFFDLIKLKNFEFSEYDNPIGFGLYSDEDLSKNKMFGLKYLKTCDTLEKKEFKKVNASKMNIIILVVLFLAGIIGLILY